MLERDSFIIYKGHSPNEARTYGCERQTDFTSKVELIEIFSINGYLSEECSLNDKSF